MITSFNIRLTRFQLLLNLGLILLVLVYYEFLQFRETGVWNWVSLRELFFDGPPKHEPEESKVGDVFAWLVNDVWIGSLFAVFYIPAVIFTRTKENKIQWTTLFQPFAEAKERRLKSEELIALSLFSILAPFLVLKFLA